MNAFDLLYQGSILLGIQYDEDEREAYEEHAQREYAAALALRTLTEHTVGGLIWWTYSP